MPTKRIIFINFGGLGDEILFLPTIQSVKKQYPDAEITLALEKRSSGIVQLTDCIDKTIFAEIKGNGKYIALLKLLIQIWSNKYDIIISSGSNKFISIFLFLTFIKEKYGYNTGKLSGFLLTKAVCLNKNRYAIQMYHELAKPITNISSQLPELSIQKKPTIPNSVLIHPGVSKLSVEKGMIKTITATQWANIIEILADKGKKVFLIGGPDDKECINTITKIIPTEKFENLYGTTKSLKDLAELISSAEKFVCSDSAPLHIAVALGVKTYAIFGSTDDKKLIPQNNNVVAIKNNCDCDLRPCLWERRQTTCEKLSCLEFSDEYIVETILNS